jgi:hypothetical protein
MDEVQNFFCQLLDPWAGYLVLHKVNNLHINQPELWKDPELNRNLLHQVCNPFPSVRREELAASDSIVFSLL